MGCICKFADCECCEEHAARRAKLEFELRQWLRWHWDPEIGSANDLLAIYHRHFGDLDKNALEAKDDA